MFFADDKVLKLIRGAGGDDKRSDDGEFNYESKY